MVINEYDFMGEHQIQYQYYLDDGGSMTFDEWINSLYPPFTQEDLDYLEDNDLK